MIQIAKSQPAPAALTTRGARHRRLLQKRQTDDPAACTVPNNTVLKARDGIYNDAQVRTQLRADQHEKCCYCEAKFTANGYGDVEHFRPKAGYQQVVDGPLYKPGYYWLAYEWDNLLFSCQICNQAHKGNYFPLANHPAARAHSHADDWTQEQPLLLNPASDDPAAHLTFEQDAAKALDARGAASIIGYGLDRPALVRKRIDHLKQVQQARLVGSFRFVPPLTATEQEFLSELRLTVAQGQAFAAEAKQIWREAARSPAEYAGMVRANFPHLPTA